MGMGQYPVLSRGPTLPSVTNPCRAGFKPVSRGIIISWALSRQPFRKNPSLSREGRPGPVTKQKVLTRCHIAVITTTLY